MRNPIVILLLSLIMITTYDPSTRRPATWIGSASSVDQLRVTVTRERETRDARRETRDVTRDCRGCFNHKTIDYVYTSSLGLYS